MSRKKEDSAVPTPISHASPPNPAATDRRLAMGELRHRWGWFVAFGLVLVLLGTVGLLNMLVATVASVYTVAILMLIGAGTQIAHAFSVKSWSGFLLWVLGGVVYAIAGFAALVNPLLASAILTLLLAAALIVSGVVRAWVGFQARPAPNWGWVVLSGAVTFLAGLVIAMGWPVNSLWVLGMFLALDLLFQGWAMIAFGLALKRR
ncbi:HdeD family acid-resistance protein [Tianweitania sediminis]|uniref:HdeD family acid-resistance protein n=2 Tax=Tianweitania sediminis TaxID=1502156 RepID=A0A8J7UI72_9HYPH|nr:HdeD family acid-resistance protein [Tianweitania sediminis]